MYYVWRNQDYIESYRVRIKNYGGNIGTHLQIAHIVIFIFYEFLFLPKRSEDFSWGGRRNTYFPEEISKKRY